MRSSVCVQTPRERDDGNNRTNHFLQKADSLARQDLLFVSVYIKINQKVSKHIISKPITVLTLWNRGDADATSTDTYIAQWACVHR
jgi:hypothetical protein